MRKIVSVAIVLALLVAGSAAPASAGSRPVHRWQGAVLALGAIGVVAAIAAADAHATAVVAPVPVPVTAGWAAPGWQEPWDGRWRGRHEPPPRVWVPGHWETVRVWVPGSWQQAWEPGCYDRYGRFAPGRSVQRRSLGRYEDRRVWRDGSYR